MKLYTFDEVETLINNTEFPGIFLFRRSRPVPDNFVEAILALPDITDRNKNLEDLFTARRDTTILVAISPNRPWDDLTPIVYLLYQRNHFYAPISRDDGSPQFTHGYRYDYLGKTSTGLASLTHCLNQFASGNTDGSVNTIIKRKGPDEILHIQPIKN